MNKTTKFTKGPWTVENVSGAVEQYYISSVDTGFGICSTTMNHQIDLKNARLIAAAPKLYDMLQSVSSELYFLIDEVNDQRLSRVNQTTEIQPDLIDQETLFLIEKLLAEARGENE